MKFFGKKNKNKVEYIAAIILQQEEGQAFLIKTDSKTKSVDVLDEKGFKYSDAWKNIVYDVDEVLFSLENTHDVAVDKASFFTYSHLSEPDTGNLKNAYLTALKDIVKENKLNALGYIDMDEILAETYEARENSPLNAVFIEVDASAVSVYVYNGGKRVFSQSTAKTEDVINDLQTIFKDLPKGLKLPARIIMYDASGVQGESSEILTHKWKDDVFIQIPQVEVVREADLKEAVVRGVQEEVFGEIPHDDSPAVSTDTDEDTSEDDEQNISDTDSNEDVGEAGEEPDNQKSTQDAKNDETLGFVVGEDIAKTSAINAEKHETEPETAAPTSVYSQDNDDEDNVDDRASETTVEPQAKPPIISRLMSNISLPSLRIPFLNKGHSMASMDNIGMTRKRIFAVGFIIAGIAILAGGVFASLRYFHSAELTLLYASDEIDEDVAVSENLEVEEVTETFTVSSSIATTGEREIGERATGTVTLFNADEDGRTFDAGTTLVTDGGLEFTLDDDVTIDGASSTITDEGDVLTSTAKQEADVTAAEIGSDYNIESDVRLSVEGFSDTTYFARTNSSFTGGSEETIQTASESDFANIDDDIDAKLEEKSREAVADVASQGNVISELTTIERTDESYSAEVAEETDQVNAEVTADVTYYAFNESTLIETILEEMKDDVPDNYIITNEDIEYEIDSAERDEDTGDITLDVEATARPRLQVDKEALQADVAGTSLRNIRTILKDTYRADGFEAQVNSPFPFLRSRLPWFPHNITVELKPITE